MPFSTTLITRPPLFSGWQQAQWYSLPQTEAWLCKLRKDILDGHEPLPTIGAMLARVPGLGSETNPSPGNRPAPSGSTTPRPCPVVAQKEPRKDPVPPSTVGSTVGLGLGRKPVVLSSSGGSKPKKEKHGRPQKNLKSSSKPT